MPKADSPPGFKPLKDTKLFSPFKLGAIDLDHRIVQAPLTRMRATKESDGVFVPEDLHVEYYGQRASKGGLQLTEATDIAKYVSRSISTYSNRRNWLEICIASSSKSAISDPYQAPAWSRETCVLPYKRFCGT